MAFPDMAFPEIALPEIALSEIAFEFKFSSYVMLYFNGT